MGTKEVDDAVHRIDSFLRIPLLNSSVALVDRQIALVPKNTACRHYIGRGPRQLTLHICTSTARRAERIASR